MLLGRLTFSGPPLVCAPEKLESEDLNAQRYFAFRKVASYLVRIQEIKISKLSTSNLICVLVLATFQEAVRYGTKELQACLQTTVQQSTMAPSSEPSRGHRLEKNPLAFVFAEEKNDTCFTMLSAATSNCASSTS